MEITAAVPTTTAATISVTRPEAGHEHERVEPATELADARFDDAGHREQDSIADENTPTTAPAGRQIGAELRIDDRTNTVYSSFVDRATGEEISSFPGKAVRANTADIHEALGRQLDDQV